MSVGRTLNGEVAYMAGYSSVGVWFVGLEEGKSARYETVRQTVTAIGDFSAEAMGTMPGSTHCFAAFAKGSDRLGKGKQLASTYPSGRNP
jgi:hypothetical protein